MIVKQRDIDKKDNLVFGMILLFVAVILFRFYRGMILCGDNPAHLNLSKILFQENIKKISYPKASMSYPLFHISTKIVAILLGGRYELAGAVVLTVSSVSTIVITNYLLEQFIQPVTVFCRWLIKAVSVASIFFGTLKEPLTEGRYYAGQCAANPWHNPTVTFVRPFGLITFYIFINLYTKMKGGKICKKELVRFSIISVLSTIAKPSYTIVLIPAAGLLVFFYWIRDLKGRFHLVMQVFAAVMPTILIIIFQFLYDTGEAGIFVKIALGSFSGFTIGQVICVSLATFPVPIALCFICKKRDVISEDSLFLAYLTLAFGWMEMFILTNGDSGDFSWGYDLSVGLSTVMAVGYVIKKCYRKWQMYFVLILFSLQTITGLHYFELIQKMDGYYWF